MSPVAYLQSIGFWGPRTVVNHGVWVDAADIKLLRSHQVSVSHNPESNMKLASGIAPVPEYLAAGVTVGLGTDGAASNNDLDMFEAMRFAALLHKVKTGDPRTLPATTALEMATINGARALGLEKQIGSLEAGKRADLVVVSTASARLTPIYDPVSHLVYAAQGDDVRTVMVNGRVLMRDRKMLTLDEPAVLAEARKFAQPCARQWGSETSGVYSWMPMKGRCRNCPALSRPYPTTNLSSISNPMYSTATSTLRRLGLLNRHAVRSDFGSRARRISCR